MASEIDIFRSLNFNFHLLQFLTTLPYKSKNSTESNFLRQIISAFFALWSDLFDFEIKANQRSWEIELSKIKTNRNKVKSLKKRNKSFLKILLGKVQGRYHKTGRFSLQTAASLALSQFFNFLDPLGSIGGSLEELQPKHVH